MGRIRGPRRADSQDWILGYGKHLTRALAEYGGIRCIAWKYKLWQRRMNTMSGIRLLLPRKKICGRRLRIPEKVGKSCVHCEMYLPRQNESRKSCNSSRCGSSFLCMRCFPCKSRRKCQTGKVRLAVGLWEDMLLAELELHMKLLLLSCFPGHAQ